MEEASSCRPAKNTDEAIKSMLRKDTDASHLTSDSSQPTSQRTCLADRKDGGLDMLSKPEQPMMFSAGPLLQGRVKLSDGDRGSQGIEGELLDDFIPVGQLLKPRSPTRQCSIPAADSSHFGSALMECKVDSEMSESIFRVQEHEMICAISSGTSFVDSDGRLVSTVDINYYWCNFCTFSTATKTLLVQHVMEHRFHCRFCRYQSFSRADVIHHSTHTHPDFKQTAATVQYCTILSDYLRSQHPTERQLDCRRKRTYSSAFGGDVNEPPSHKESRPVQKSGRRTVQKKFSADYVVFDVDVGDKGHVGEEGGKDMIPEGAGSKTDSPSPSEEVKKVATPPTVGSGSASSSSVTTGHSDSALPQPVCSLASDLIKQCSTSCTDSSVPKDFQPASQVSSESVFPPNLIPESFFSSGLQRPGSRSSMSSFSCGSRSCTPSPPNLSSVSTGSVHQGPSQWICFYCKYSSASHSGIKRHWKRQHRGKPFKFLSPGECEGSAPPLLRYDNGKLSNSAAVQGCGVGMSEETACSVRQTDCAADQEPVQNSHCDEPPVLVKQESVESDPPVGSVEPHVPIPLVSAESAVDWRCFYCDYRCHLLQDLRNHAFAQHDGKSLRSLDAKGNTVYMCSKSSCNFSSSLPRSFLEHTQVCIPWLASSDSTTFLEQPAPTCPQATTRSAEEDSLTSSLSSAVFCYKDNLREFSCIYCKNGFVSSKNETKQHVLDFHGSECLVIRNVFAHSKRKKSSVFFCRWCLWEGDTKHDFMLHSVFCRDQSKSAICFAEKASRKVCGAASQPNNTKEEESSCKIPTSNTNDVRLKQGPERELGSGDNTLLKPPIIASAKLGSETPFAGCVQQDASLEVSSIPLSSSTDDRKSSADVIPDHDLEVSMPEDSLPDLASAVDGLECDEKFDSCKDMFGLTLSPADASVCSGGVCQMRTDPGTPALEKDAVSVPFFSDSSNTGDCSEQSSNQDMKPSVALNILQDFGTCNSGIKTDALAVTSQAPQTCVDDRAVGNIGDPGHNVPSINCAKDSELLSNMPLHTNSAGSSISHSINLPCAGVLETKMSCSPVGMPSESLNSGHVGPDATAAGSHCRTSLASSLQGNPGVVDSLSLTAIAPNTHSSASNCSDSSHGSSDIQVKLNSAHSTESTDEYSGSSDRVSEQGPEEEMQVSVTPSATGALDGNCEPGKKLFCHNARTSKQASSQDQRENRVQYQCARSRTSHAPKQKAVWSDGQQVKCSKCDFLSRSLVSLKAHVLSAHSEMVSIPFRSVYHRDMHYKSNFFACPSVKCMTYNYDESVVVSHYRKCHQSQHHPYAEPDYTPAPTKYRHRSGTKAREPKKPSKPSVQILPHVTKVLCESAEQTFMCLYCEQNVYTVSVSQMKAHYLSQHPGQPITIRNVNDHRERRPSRFFMCQQPACEYWTYERRELDKHVETQHQEQQQTVEDRSYQCAACGWITSEAASVQDHVSVMHQSEGGATVVTLAHTDDRRAVEERYIMCRPETAEGSL